MTMAVSLLLRAHPSVSMVLYPSNGGSFTLQSFAGDGLEELCPEASGASLIADGAMVVRMKARGSWKRFVYIMLRSRCAA